MSRTHRLAWAAGFFDGEGYITIGKRKREYKEKVYSSLYLRIGINHVAKEPILEFKNLFGGSLEYNAKVLGNRHPRWRWVANTHTAKEILLQLLPYLKNKNRVVEIALEFQNTIQPNKSKVLEDIVLYREQLREKLKTMNSED